MKPSVKDKINKVNAYASIFKDEDEFSDDEIQFVFQRVINICENLEYIDKKLDEISVGWKVRRMNQSDLTALRLAYYEIHFENDVPLAAAINEAVELAKHYGTDNSGSFVNGVLARVASSKDKKDMADKQDTVDADEVRSSEGGADITEETIEEKAEAADC